jgi:hypothetical protein
MSLGSSFSILAISGLSFARSGSTLHQLLSLAELFFFLSAIYAVVMNVWRRSKVAKRSKEPRLPVTTAKSEIPALPLAAARQHLTSSITRMLTKHKGSSSYSSVAFCFLFAIIFGAGIVVGSHWQRSLTFYNWRVQKVLSADSLNIISKETGPFRADFCPANHFAQYEPKAGYVICRIQYVDRGCIDNKSLSWVKNSAGWTATLTDSDTFRPWPDCHVDETLASR